jgi:hypothetical protein
MSKKGVSAWETPFLVLFFIEFIGIDEMDAVVLFGYLLEKLQQRFPVSAQVGWDCLRVLEDNHFPGGTARH